MPPHDLSQLGDEPLYANTHDDHVLYSGSDDEYYEGPEVRRTRIEAKAIQYLNGNVPYLLSARLRGPFDATSWRNPWRSKQAHRQAAAQSAPPSRPSMTSVQGARSPSSNKASHDLPDTQRTSLFPLPSPESTNPPSAKSNPYMAEDQYNRIKTWRTTVNKGSVSTDPFWNSYRDETQRLTESGKRPGDQDWLHGRASKKRKSKDLRQLPHDESPSRAAAAAKARGSQLSGRRAEVGTQSAPGSSTHENELAAQWGPKTASFDTSHLANRPVNTPQVLSRERTTGPCLLSSQAGLSVQASASESRAVAPVHDQAKKPRVARAVDSHTPPWQQSQAESDGENLDSRMDGADVDTDISAWQEETRGDKAKLTMQKATTTLDADAANNETTQASLSSSARVLAKSSRKTVIGATQRDDSFCFHQARPKHISPPKESLPADQMDGTTRSLLPSQHGTAAAEMIIQEDTSRSHGATRPHGQADALPNNSQEVQLEAAIETTIVTDVMMTDALPLSLARGTTDPRENETPSMHESRPQDDDVDSARSQPEKLVICTNAEPHQSKQACTQELSPVSMQDAPQGPDTSTAMPEGSPSKVPPGGDNIDASDPEWSTYVATQDHSTGSESRQQIAEAAKDAEVASKDEADPDDPEWATYVNTQDITAPAVDNGMMCENAEGLPIVVQGPGDSSDPEWSTFLNSQHSSIAQLPPPAPRASESEQAVEHEEPVDQLVGNDESSDSEWSSCTSASSKADAEYTSNTSNELVLAGSPAVELKLTQDTVNESRRVEDTTVLDEASSSSRITMAPRAVNDQVMDPAEETMCDFDGNTASLECPNVPAADALVQSPWAKGPVHQPMPVDLHSSTMANETTSRLSLLADQALGFSPAPQTPWLGDRLPSPNFSLSVKRFSDFMKPSPRKKRLSANRSILRGSDSTSHVLFGTPSPAKPERHVTFAQLSGDQETSLADRKGNMMEEDLSYYDATGNKTACIRITRSRTRAASPPPSDVNMAHANKLPDHDNKFARHFEAMSKRNKEGPGKTQRLLPSESQQTNSSQAIDAMAEAFIQASQTRRRSADLVHAVADDDQASQSTPVKIVSSVTTERVDDKEEEEPVDDVSAVLDNLDEFLENSWGINTGVDMEVEASAMTKQRMDAVPVRFAHVGDPMLAMHTNVWAE